MTSTTPNTIWDEYMVWYYHSYVWKQTFYHGVRTLKFPSDMWNYQEIIFERGIDWIIETGTRHGGSALFFKNTLAARKATGYVISVDIDSDSNVMREDKDIQFVIGDSASQETVSHVFGMLPEERGPIFVILDSDHAKGHVLRELEAYVPRMKSGDYLIVEDSNVNGHPVRPDFGPGPWEAIQEFIKLNPGTLIPDKQRERKFGATAAPDGYYIKA